MYAAVPSRAVLTAVGWHHLLDPARRLLLPLAVTATLALQALRGTRMVRELWLPPGGSRSRRRRPPDGAGCRGRTDDLPLTRRLLYH